MAPRSRVLLADDHTLLLEAFLKLLEPEFEVVGTAKDGQELVEAAAALAPDAVVTDVTMPRLNGIEACRRIKQASPGIAVVFLTVNADAHVAAEAFLAGGSGYLLKSSTADELVAAVRAALEGRRFLCGAIAGGDVDALPVRPASSPWARLSPREREVVQLLTEGKTMKQAAALLGITARTVEFYKYRAMMALGVKSGAELIRIAIERKLG